MPLFAELLHDSDERVRMGAPEMFRVIGKSRPEFVRPYLEELRHIAATDPNSVFVEDFAINPTLLHNIHGCCAIKHPSMKFWLSNIATSFSDIGKKYLCPP